MKFAGDITADFNSHPAAAVVIDSVHGTIGIVQSKGIADHGVPLAGEVAPVFSSFRKSDQDRPHCATHLGIWTLTSRHDRRNTIEMIYNHLVAQDFPVK